MQEYRIIIGIGEDRNGLTILYNERNKALNQARKLLTNWFNGFTEYWNYGGWLNNQGELVAEAGITFSVFANAAGRPSQAAEQIAYLFNQQSVILIHPNGDVEFIEPEYETQADEPLEKVLYETGYFDPEATYADGRDTFSGH